MSDGGLLGFDAELAEDLLATALRAGGEFAELYAETRVNRAVSAEDGRIERVNLGREGGVGIRVIADGHAAFAYSEDPDPQALQACAASVGKMARTGSRVAGKHAALVRPPKAFDQPDDGWSELPFETVEHMTELVLRADSHARRLDSRVRQVTPLCVDTDQRVLVANSEGCLAQDRRVRVRLRVRTLLRERNGRSATGIETRGGTTDYRLLAGGAAEQLAEEAVHQAAHTLDAVPVPAGEMPVVLAPGSGGVLMHEACGHGLEADIAVGIDAVYGRRLGEPVSAAGVTYVDDPTRPDAWGSYRIDDEGTPAAPTVLIDEGRLTSLLTDRRHARNGGSTANGRRASFRHLPIPRMSNTYVRPGPFDPEEVVADTSFGLYARRISGGSVEPTSGDFTFAVREAYLIRRGRIAEPVHGTVLTGNSLEALARIDRVADDLEFVPASCGKDGQRAWVSVGQPTLRISKLRVSGSER